MWFHQVRSGCGDSDYTLGMKTSAPVETRTTESVPMALTSRNRVTAEKSIDLGGLEGAARRQKFDIRKYLKFLLNFSSVHRGSWRS